MDTVDAKLQTFKRKYVGFSFLTDLWYIRKLFIVIILVVYSQQRILVIFAFTLINNFVSSLELYILTSTVQ